MPMQSPKTRASHQAGPASIFLPVEPNDLMQIPHGVTKALHVGMGGSLVVEDELGNVATFVSTSGQYHPIRVTKVHATGTTASNIVALY